MCMMLGGAWSTHIIQIRFGVTCHVYDVGWSVVYDMNAAGDTRHDR